MNLKVEVKRLLKKYIDYTEREYGPYPLHASGDIKVALESFADWLDDLDIEKVIGNKI